MTNLDFWGFRVEVDEQATKNWYDASNGWGCECGDCRNFLVLAQARQLPGEILTVLDRLGIPPEKATYVCEMYPDGDRHCYQVSYRLAGRILEETDKAEQDRNAGRCCHEPYPYGAIGFPEPHFDLEFWPILPWVLEKSEDR